MKREIKQYLIEKAIDGDAEAFGEIYFALRDSIYGYARRMIGEAAAAEDVTQEVFMFFVKHPRRFDASRGTLFSFLCGVARNKILNHLKKSGTKFEAGNDETENFDERINTDEKSPLTILLDREFAAKVEECVARLAPLQREALILREMEDFSYDEIARLTETEIGVVKSRLLRARRALARELAPYMKNEKECFYEMH